MRTPPPARHNRHRRRSHAQGFVLLVVMFVLLMAGTTSMIALDSSRTTLRAAGHQRMAAQVRYMAEGVMQQGIVLADNVADPVFGIPNLHDFGEPPLPAVGYGGKAYRLTPGQFAMTRFVAYEAPVWAEPDPIADPIGTMGPDSGWSPGHALAAGHQHFVLHLTDCVGGKAAAAAGAQMAGGNVNQGQMSVTQYCIAHGRARSAAPGSATRTWTIPGLGADYVEQVLAIDRTAVATVVITKEATP